MSSLTSVSTAGGAVLAALFAYKTKFPSTFFSYHPTLLGIGWLALAPWAIGYLRESKKSTSVEDKDSKVQKHAILNGLLQICAYGGVYVIWRNKEIMAASKKEIAKHLVSLHGKLGALSTVLLVASGAIASFKAMTGKRFPEYRWRNKLHVLLGKLSYVSAGACILAIVNGPWGKFNLGLAGQKAVSAAILAIQALVVAPWVGAIKA